MILCIPGFLGELEARVGPLEKECEKANRFLELSARRKELEVTLWVDTVQRARDPVREAARKMEIAESDYASMTKQIDALEEGLADELSRDVVYAAALLHDIGRATQYEMEEPHDIAGVRIARSIMGTVEDGCAFSPAEQDLIAGAIGAHRDGADAASPLARLLYRADKLSRPCFACTARPECNWPEEQQNLAVRV